LVILLGVISITGLKILFSIKKYEIPEEVTVVAKKMPGTIESFEPMIVNVRGQRGVRYLKVTVGVEFTEKRLSSEIAIRKVQLTDILNTVLSSQPMDKIQDTNQRDDIKREIRDKLNEVLINGQIKNVFFSDFVVQ